MRHLKLFLCLHFSLPSLSAFVVFSRKALCWLNLNLNVIDRAAQLIVSSCADMLMIICVCCGHSHLAFQIDSFIPFSSACVPDRSLFCYIIIEWDERDKAHRDGGSCNLTIVNCNGRLIALKCINCASCGAPCLLVMRQWTSKRDNILLLLWAHQIGEEEKMSTRLHLSWHCDEFMMKAS